MYAGKKREEGIKNHNERDELGRGGGEGGEFKRKERRNAKGKWYKYIHIYTHICMIYMYIYMSYLYIGAHNNYHCCHHGGRLGLPKPIYRE